MIGKFLRHFLAIGITAQNVGNGGYGNMFTLKDEKVLNILKQSDSPMTPTAIAKGIGYSNSSDVFYNITKLIHKGFVESLGSGLYREKK